VKQVREVIGISFDDEVLALHLEGVDAGSIPALRPDPASMRIGVRSSIHDVKPSVG
jgi:hypothetical protein